jgi:hypothetical protein
VPERPFQEFKRSFEAHSKDGLPAEEALLEFARPQLQALGRPQRRESPSKKYFSDPSAMKHFKYLTREQKFQPGDVNLMSDAGMLGRNFPRRAAAMAGDAALHEVLSGGGTNPLPMLSWADIAAKRIQEVPPASREKVLEGLIDIGAESGYLPAAATADPRGRAAIRAAAVRFHELQYGADNAVEAARYFQPRKTIAGLPSGKGSEFVRDLVNRNNRRNFLLTVAGIGAGVAGGGYLVNRKYKHLKKRDHVLERDLKKGDTMRYAGLDAFLSWYPAQKTLSVGPAAGADLRNRIRGLFGK